MNLSPDRYIAISQLILGISIALCLAIIPGYFFSLDQGGLSNYGTESTTIALFSLAFGAAAIGTLMAGIKLTVTTPKQHILRIGLLILALVYALVLASTFPYKLNEDYRRYHELAALMLFFATLVGAVWLRLVMSVDIKVRRAFLIFMFGFAAGLLTLFEVLHVLFSSQILCGVSFGYLLTHGVKRITDTEEIR